MMNNLDPIKEDVNLLAIIAGTVGAFLKAVKNHMKLKDTIIQTIVGGILGFGTLGVLMLFTEKLSANMIILVAFSAGWAAYAITDVIDKAVNDAYEAAKDKMRIKRDLKK